MHNPIILNCYTYRDDVYRNYPIQPTKQQIPAWWKNLSPTVPYENGELKTMRSCLGFNEYFAKGFSVPMWDDVEFIIGETINHGIECSIHDLQVHPAEQRGEYLPEVRYQHLKLVPPWYIECEEDVKFILNANTWAIDNPEEIIIPPGIIDYKIQNFANINMFLVYNGIKRTINIKAGTSLINIIQLSDRKIEIHNHLIDFETFVEKNNSSQMLAKHIKNNSSYFLSKYAAENQQCPFHKS